MKRAFSTPASAASCSAAATKRGATSTPTASPVGPTSPAIRCVVSPKPQPTSSTRCPGRGGNRRSAASPCSPRPVMRISRNWTKRSKSGPSQATVVSSLTPVHWGELAIDADTNAAVMLAASGHRGPHRDRPRPPRRERERVHRRDPAAAGAAGPRGVRNARDGTSLQGPTQEILALVGELHDVPFGMGVPRVYTVLKLDERRDKPDQTLDDKVRSVEERLGGPG